MAPYYGPSLAGFINQLTRGTVSITLGRGVPALTVERTGDGYTIVSLTGGAGLGVQPGMMQPIVPADDALRVDDRDAAIEAVVQRWDVDRFGSGFDGKERVELQFTCEDRRALQFALRTALEIGLADADTIVNAGCYTATTIKAVRDVSAAITSCGLRVRYAT